MTNIRDQAREIGEEYMAEAFTGCIGAGDYAKWAEDAIAEVWAEYY